MKVTWGTYANNIGHIDFAGCFRCHDDSQEDGRRPGDRAGLRTLPQDAVAGLRQTGRAILASCLPLVLSQFSRSARPAIRPLRRWSSFTSVPRLGSCRSQVRQSARTACRDPAAGHCSGVLEAHVPEFRHPRDGLPKFRSNCADIAPPDRDRPCAGICRLAARRHASAFGMHQGRRVLTSAGGRERRLQSGAPSVHSVSGSRCLNLRSRSWIHSSRTAVGRRSPPSRSLGSRSAGWHWPGRRARPACRTRVRARRRSSRSRTGPTRARPTCLSCHEDKGAATKQGPHSRAFRAGSPMSPTGCQTCHGDTKAALGCEGCHGAGQGARRRRRGQDQDPPLRERCRAKDASAVCTSCHSAVHARAVGAAASTTSATWAARRATRPRAEGRQAAEGGGRDWRSARPATGPSSTSS